LKKTGKPLVVVYIEGRPLNKNWADENANALLTAYYPGEQGGNAVADVLFGDYNPAGRLPVSVPRHVGQLPVYYNQSRPVAHDYVEMSAKPLYPFGYGLSYTSFEYSELSIAAGQVSFKITNTGSRTGDEVVQFYVSNTGASVVQPERQLIGFERVTLEAGESRIITFNILPVDLAIVNDKMQWAVEGEHLLLIGSSSEDIRLTGRLEF
jgi:beta-glucosidase